MSETTKDETYRLSVQVSRNGLSFLMKDTADSRTFFEKDLAFGTAHTPDELVEAVRTAYKEYPELGKPVSELTAVHRSNIFSLVPKALFEKDKLPEYLRYTSKLFPQDHLDYDTIDRYGLVNVYAPFAAVNDFFFEKYGTFTFRHSNTVFVTSVLDKLERTDGRKMYVNVSPDSMDVLVTKGRAVELCNTFQHTTPEDFMYYILFVAEQLQLDPEVFELKLTGDISKGDELYDIAYTYVRHTGLLSDAHAHHLRST